MTADNYAITLVILAALSPLLSAAVVWLKSDSVARSIEKQATNTKELELKINSRLDQLLLAARREGRQEGIDEERKKPT